MDCGIPLQCFYTFSDLAKLLGHTDRLSTIQPITIIAMSILAVGLFAILLSIQSSNEKDAVATPVDRARLVPRDIDIDRTLCLKTLMVR